MMGFSGPGGGSSGATLATNTFTGLQTITQGTANAGIIASTGYSLTGSDATNMLDFAGTWNTSGSPTALKINITNTASGGTTNLMDLQIGSASKFKVNKSGSLDMAGSTTITGYISTANHIYLEANGTNLYFGAVDDAIIGRNAAASLRLGAADAAAPVAQTLGVQSVVGGTTDTAGAAWSIVASLGTGSGIPGAIIFKSSVAAASSSTQHTAAAAFTIANTSATGLRFNGYGAGAITSDAGGNLTAVSDPSMKFIQRDFEAGLDEVTRVNPVVYKWRPESGMDPDNEYAGFDARNVRDAIPMATWENKDGLLSLQDRALLAACVNAIKELDARIQGAP